MAYNKTDTYKYLLFVTKSGMVKKTRVEEYKTKRSTGIQGVKLKDDDEIVDISFINDEDYIIATHEGLGIRISTTELAPTGRVTQGVIGIKLGKNDYVVSGTKVLNNTTNLVTITEKGYIKQTNIAEYPLCNRATKGSALQKIEDDDFLAAILTLAPEDKEIIVICKKKCIKFSTNEIQLSSRPTRGTHSIKLDSNETVQNLVRCIE